MADADAAAGYDAVHPPVDTDEEILQVTAVYLGGIYPELLATSRVTGIRQSRVRSDGGWTETLQVFVIGQTDEYLVRGSIHIDPVTSQVVGNLLGYMAKEQAD